MRLRDLLFWPLFGNTFSDPYSGYSIWFYGLPKVPVFLHGVIWWRCGEERILCGARGIFMEEKSKIFHWEIRKISPKIPKRSPRRCGEERIWCELEGYLWQDRRHSPMKRRALQVYTHVVAHIIRITNTNTNTKTNTNTPLSDAALCTHIHMVHCQKSSTQGRLMC